jgi:3-methyladenine DNA glycosylase/8-oxoguanine DNA glycosylase
MPDTKNAEATAMTMSRVTLNPVPPYDFFLSTRLFSFADSPPKDCFQIALPLGEHPALISVIAAGTVDRPLLTMHIRAKNPLAGDQVREATELTASVLNLSLDLSPFYQSVKTDPVLESITGKLRGLKPRKTPTVFEALVRSILEQQISLIAAHRIQERLIHAYGTRLILDEVKFHVFPTPEQLSRASATELRALGLSKNKATYILDIAREVSEGIFPLEGLANEKDTDLLLSRLTEIRGVGEWTAEMVILRGIGRYDAFPATDLGLRRTLSNFYHGRDEVMSVAEVRHLTESWGFWKGLAGFYLIAAELTGIQLR